jgi:hypothetical protein
MKDLFLESLYTEELFEISALPMIIIDKPWTAVTPEEREQLQRITEALRQRIHPSLRLDGFQVIHQAELNLNSLQPRPAKAIYFGSPIKGLNYFEVIEVNATRLVLSESLELLIKTDTSRQMLWKALQVLFAQ